MVLWIGEKRPIFSGGFVGKEERDPNIFGAIFRIDVGR